MMSIFLDISSVDRLSLSVYRADMNIIINGEKKEFPASLTFEQLLSGLGVDPRKVAVERNLTIVPRTTYATTAVNDGDEIEIIKFIGGG